MNQTDNIEEPALSATRTDFSSLRQAAEQIKEELKKVIVGQEQLVEHLLVAVLADGHVLLEGMPGVAKTLLAKLLARTIRADFSRLQFTPDLMPSDVLGTSVFHPNNCNFEFKKGPIFSNIVLIDEINRAPAKTQAALFEVMEERQITFDGTTYPFEEPFLVLATQNPVEQEGTYRLPEEIVNLRELVREVHVTDKLLAYIAQIVVSTRNHRFLFLGASPRASVALLNASKALAALRGRDFVTPEDVQELAPAVLRHRILLTPEKEMEGTSPDELIRQIMHTIEVPR